MGLGDGRVAAEPIYRDQASLLIQMRVFGTTSLPVAGSDQARALLHSDVALDRLISD
jgi:hypothetical protein